MKKRLLSFVLAVATGFALFLLSSCEKETAYSLLSEAVGKTLSADALSVRSERRSTAEFDIDLSVSTATDATFSVVGYQSESPRSTLSVSKHAFDADSEMTFYREGDYTYADVDGSRFRLENADAPAQYRSYVSFIEQIPATIVALPESVMEDVEIITIETGTKSTKSILLTLTAEEFEEYFPEYTALNETKETFRVLYRASNLTVSDITLSVEVDAEGKLTDYRILYTIHADCYFAEKQTSMTAETVDAMHFETSALPVSAPEGYLNYSDYALPAELVGDAVEKTLALTELDATVKTEMTLQSESLTLEMPTVITFTGSGLGTEAQVRKETMTVSTFGLDITIDLYEKDDYVYASLAGFGMKTKKAALGETEVFSGFRNLEAVLVALGEDALANSQILYQEDGTRRLTVPLSAENASEIYSELIGDASASIAEDESSLSSVVISNVIADIIVDRNGYVLSYSVQYDMHVEIDLGELMAALGMPTISYDASVNTTAEIRNPGDPVTITPIEGYESFEEVSADQFLE